MIARNELVRFEEARAPLDWIEQRQHLRIDDRGAADIEERRNRADEIAQIVEIVPRGLLRRQN